MEGSGLGELEIRLTLRVGNNNNIVSTSGSDIVHRLIFATYGSSVLILGILGYQILQKGGTQGVLSLTFKGDIGDCEAERERDLTTVGTARVLVGEVEKEGIDTVEVEVPIGVHRLQIVFKIAHVSGKLEEREQKHRFGVIIDVLVH
jgi:hypothetical protein